MITRRGFLQSTAGALAFGGGLSPMVGRVLAAQTDDGGRKNGRIFVIITLAGGNDGLNTVVPFENDIYYKSRPTIGHAKRDILKLNDQTGLHPVLKKTHAAFKEGRVAAILGVGYPNANRSHFHSMDVWQSGDPELNITRSGWLGRACDVAPDANNNAMFAFHIGEETPRLLLAETRRITTFSSLQDYNITPDRLAQNDRPKIEKAWRAMSAEGNGAPRSIQLARGTMAQALASAGELRDVLSKSTSNINYPGGGLAQNLRLTAQVIGAELPVRIVSLTIGGFDTHANQKGTHSQLWQTIDDAVAAFYEDLKQRGRAADVSVMLYSEFGRRVAENGSAGTDHGAAAPVLVFGEGITGGVYGEHPDLTKLDDGDLKYTTDFRRVYATILDRWLNVPSEKILSSKHEPLPFLLASNAPARAVER